MHFSEETGPRALTFHMQSVPVSMSRAATKRTLKRRPAEVQFLSQGGIPQAREPSAHSSSRFCRRIADLPSAEGLSQQPYD